MKRKKVLITGAAGKIGSVLRSGLKESYDLRVMYHRTVLPAEDGEEVFVAPINALDKIEEVVDGVGTPSSTWLATRAWVRPGRTC